MRILVIEDEPKLATLISRALKQEGWEAEIALDGDDGLDLALTGAFDAIILDRLLPRRSGIEVLHALRAERVDTPVLMLTALGDLPDRVSGLDAGADDYLGKPFAFAELFARIRALTRRGDKPVLQETIEAGGLILNRTARTVAAGQQPIDLTPREYALLEMLVLNRRNVLSRDQMLERVWGYEADPAGNIVDLYIHYLRRKLAVAGIENVIVTVRGAGYRFEAG